MNILEANEKREQLYKKISIWGRNAFILIGITGGIAMESKIFGLIFIIVGIILDFYMNGKITDLKKRCGALTGRKLSDGDLKGLRKDELEQLRCHIYAIHGYKFNVNDGLLCLVKIFNKLNSLYPNGFKFDMSNIYEPCNRIGCTQGKLIMVLDNYSLISKKKDYIKNMSEEQKDDLREILDRSTNKGLYVGYYNRDGEGHEGYHFYQFKDYYWYKPTTNNLEEVYAKMSEFEKYNVELIKAQEAKCP